MRAAFQPSACFLPSFPRPVVVGIFLVVAPDNDHHPEPPHYTSDDTIRDFAFDSIAAEPQTQTAVDDA